MKSTSRHVRELTSEVDLQRPSTIRTGSFLKLACLLAAAGIAVLAGSASLAAAQQPPTVDRTTTEGADSFVPGRPLGVSLDGDYTAISDNVRVFGSFRFSESCVFDPGRDLIVAINRGMSRTEIENDGYVSLIHPDGRVHTTKWIGETRDGLWLDDPLGSAVLDRVLYVVDVDMVRMFDLDTGTPLGAFEVNGATGLNGIAVAQDGTKYVSSVREGGISRIRPGERAELIAWGIPSAASMCHDPVRRQLVIPMNSHNALAFVSLED